MPVPFFVFRIRGLWSTGPISNYVLAGGQVNYMILKRLSEIGNVNAVTCLLMVVLLLFGFSPAVSSDTIKVYRASGSLVYKLDGSSVSNAHGSTVARIDGSQFYTSSGSLSAKLENGKLYNSSGSLIAKFEGGSISNSRGSTIGRIDGGQICDAHGATVGRIEGGSGADDNTVIFMTALFLGIIH